MDAGSLQGEREFQNEILFAGKIESEYIVTVIGMKDRSETTPYGAGVRAYGERKLTGLLACEKVWKR
ncbi:putative non-specific serine/threonine protein kinase [Helianthus annuus]|nr:putative non-specific serine/threonine protein kinase [Helianthus annuus]